MRQTFPLGDLGKALLRVEMDNGATNEFNIPINSTGFRALIDTGAEGTVVDHSVVSRLELRPSLNGKRRVVFLSVSKEPRLLDTYECGITFCLGNELLRVRVEVCADDFSGRDFDILVGLDILALMFFEYNGPSNSFTLEYNKKPAV